MTPEEVLSALVTHSMLLDFGKPDPLIMARREDKIGKAKPMNWRLLIEGEDKELRVELSPSIHSAQGTQTFRPSTHSVAEVAADALIGMYERNWHTLQLAIGVGGVVRPFVTARLLRVAYRMQKSERIWLDSVRRKPCPCGRSAAADYVPDLVELAIRDLESPFVYKTHRAKWEWFGLSERRWHGAMSRPFDHVAAHIWSWYYAGIGHIQNRIRQRGERLE